MCSNRTNPMLLTTVLCVVVPNFILFAQDRRPIVGQWWLVSVEPHDKACVPCPDEEYYVEILKVHSNGKADIQDLEECSDPEHGVQFNRHS